MESRIPVDTAYLSTNLTATERKKLLNGHPDALKRSRQYQQEVELFINQVVYLHFEAGLTPLQITAFYRIGQERNSNNIREAEELLAYIERVIQHKSEN